MALKGLDQKGNVTSVEKGVIQVNDNDPNYQAVVDGQKARYAAEQRLRESAEGDGSTYAPETSSIVVTHGTPPNADNVTGNRRK